MSFLVSLCSSLSAEVSVQHSGHRERKDQTNSVRPRADRPILTDQLSQEVSVTGNEPLSHITHDVALCWG